MNKYSISGCTYFFFTGNPNTWLPETHPPTQIRTLFGFVNPYELLDAPLLVLTLSKHNVNLLMIYMDNSGDLNLLGTYHHMTINNEIGECLK